MKQQTLSDKIYLAKKPNGYLNSEDVKNFIKKLKEEFDMAHINPADYIRFLEIIDKLAGSKLT